MRQSGIRGTDPAAGTTKIAMTTEFKRLNRTHPERTDRTQAQGNPSPHSDSATLAEPRTGGDQASPEAIYRPTPLDETATPDILTIGSARLELLGGLRATIANHHDKRWPQFYDYWMQLAEQRGALPSRQAIDPLQMPRRLLGNIYLTEVVYETGNQARFRFRLLGQEITEREYTRPGQYLHELGGNQSARLLETQYLDCLQGRLWLRQTNLSWADRQKSFMRYQVLLMPLARDGHEVDSMIGLVIYED